MTLAPVVLDDLTWDQMVAAIRRRIPAESAGNWTLYAPVDPGITFLDLFAFLAEQRLYWLDQVPSAFVVAVLGLLGLSGPLPAVPAATGGSTVPGRSTGRSAATGIRSAASLGGSMRATATPAASVNRFSIASVARAVIRVRRGRVRRTETTFRGLRCA